MKDLKEESTVSTVAKINNVEIVIIENGEKRVAIKPICDALGVDFSGQLQRIKNDEILGSTVEIISTVGGDKKAREMQTIPFMFVFGWLFRIDSRKVKTEAKETVVKYQLECYKALYNHFTRQSEFLEQRQKAIEAQIEEGKRLRRNFKDAELRLKDARNELDRVRSVTFHQWMADKSQLQLFTAEEQEG